MLVINVECFALAWISNASYYDNKVVIPCCIDWKFIYILSQQDLNLYQLKF